MSGRAQGVGLGLALLLALVGGAAGATSATPSFRLVFDGKHDANLWHEGSFTSSLETCPSGYAVDIEVAEPTLTATRRFTCAGGDEFTARIATLRAEHGGTGTWTILEGSGSLTELRGTGPFTSVRLSGSTADPASLTFRSTWTTNDAVDTTPPVINVTTASARKLAGRIGAWRLRTLFTVADAGGPVSWQLVVSDRRKPSVPLVKRSGRSATGSVVVVLVARVPTGARVLRLRIDGTDATGNRTSAVRLLRLP